MSATVILADDDPNLRAVYAPLLRAVGHTVLEASDGREAVALVRAKRPELLILDIWMPALNGFEVLEQLRYEPAASHLKVLVLSSLGDADSRLEAFGAGAVSYFVKGVSLNDLLAEVGRVLDDEVAVDLA
jgi:DNA-binding response OmpR family regulator